MTKPVLEVGDIVKINTSSLRYKGYGAVLGFVGNDLVSLKRLIDRHGYAVNVGNKKSAAITMTRSACIVLNEDAINKMYEDAIAQADVVRTHLLSNRKR